MRAEVAFVLLLTGVAACGGTVTPPDTPAPDTAASAAQDTVLKSASLLRRLAEAADGYRDGADRFVVAAREFPHKVVGVFLTKAEADSVAADSSTSTLHYEAFGPYRTAAEAGVSPEVDDVDSVVAYYAGGEQKTYDGKKYDALFWSLPAFDKFVAPYLTSVSGADYAQSQRQAYKSGELTESALSHKRDSF
jgi:hypothetical protein